MTAPKRDRKGRFPKGASGNPGGRPTRSAQYAKRYPQLQENGPAIIAVAIDLALGGDRDALSLLVPRLMPALRPVDVPVALAAGADKLGPVEAVDAVVAAVMSGVVSPDVGERIASTIRTAVAVRSGGVGAESDADRGRALRELRELMLGGRPDVPPPPADSRHDDDTGGDDADA